MHHMFFRTLYGGILWTLFVSVIMALYGGMVPLCRLKMMRETV